MLLDSHRSASVLVVGTLIVTLVTAVQPFPRRLDKATSHLATTDCVYDGVNLSSIPVSTLVIPQLYQGSTSLFTWVLSLCAPLNAPPAGQSSCAHAGFISEYDSAGTHVCESAWDIASSFTRLGPDALLLSFAQSTASQHPGWTASVTLACGGDSPDLVANGSVIVTGTDVASLNFAFEFTTSALCAPEPPSPSPPARPCRFSGFDLSQIPRAELAINQVYQGAVSPYAWVVDFCSLVNVPPAGVPGCSTAGFISEYSSAACETTWDNITGSFSSGPESLTLELAQSTSAKRASSSWTASATLQCGSTPALLPAAEVIVTGSSPDALHFKFLFNTSVVCSSAKQPPILPQYFEGLFTEYTAYDDKHGPPYVNGVPPAPLVASRGAVYYDWTKRNMIEVRYDYCVNIFPTAGHDFPCTFQNVNGTSYLITYNRSAVLPACCVFGKPWYPPEPAFLRQNVTSVFVDQTPWNNGEANWFTVPSISPPTGPFFYSFNASIPESEPQVYTSFAFPGLTGWVQQSFYNIAATQPDDSVWELPSICLPVESLPSCDFFGSNSGSSSGNGDGH